jgi:phosphoadenosine phosphosulfate reductase
MNITEEAIKLLQDNEPKEGYHLAFSGGKDSVVIKELARLSGVKYESHFAITSVDPPELLDFIRNHHKDAIWHKPKLTMYQLILKNKMPPLMTARYCCRYLKEYLGIGEVTVTGIRRAESPKRANRQTIEETKNKKFVNPIIYWSDKSVWNFIYSHKLPYCSLYDEGFSRIGCIGCPMCSPRQSEFIFQRYPKHKNAYIKTFKKMMPNYKYKDNFKDAEDLFNQWISRYNMKQWIGKRQQINLDFT